MTMTVITAVIAEAIRVFALLMSAAIKKVKRTANEPPEMAEADTAATAAMAEITAAGVTIIAGSKPTRTDIVLVTAMVMTGTAVMADMEDTEIEAVSSEYRYRSKIVKN